MRRLALAALLYSLPAFAAESGGQADVGFQGYSLGGNAQAPESIGGLSVGFREFLPRVGVLSGNLEGYANGQLQTGENFLELQAVPWLGRRWTFRGGDFRTPASLVEIPFYNVFVPEVSARGVRIAAGHGSTEYEFFYGRETIEEGPQLPFRVMVPQSLMGAAARYRHGRLQAGVRYLRFSSNPSDILREPTLFPTGREFGRIDSFTAQALYRLAGSVRLYGDVTGAAAGQAAGAGSVRPSPFSMLAGLSWETPGITARANYTRQSATYFPLAGYFAGDREGPFAEIRYRPWKGFEALGSASRYRNNLAQNPDAAKFESTSLSAGATVKLPLNSTGTAQLSIIRFSSQPAGSGSFTDSRNRHLSAGLARPFRRHTVRVAMHDLMFTAGAIPERQHWVEVEDTFRLKRIVLGANVRTQQAVTDQRRNTVYVRGMVEFHTRRLTAFTNIEAGNDVINQTVFATNSYRTTVAGITGHLDRNWDIQVEAFRNSLNMALNPENVFVLESGGIGVANALSSLNQWSLFVRLRRHLEWGTPPAAADLDRYVSSQVPLEGTVEGFVRERRLTGESPAADIPVSLDGNRTTTSDAEGRFRFSEVAEGGHRVMLSRTELPADYNPGPESEAMITVHPRRTSRADFTVRRLTSLAGVVTGPGKIPVENILIRLLPGNRYTTTREGGRFAFHNLREGDYEAVIEAGTLPDGAGITGSERVAAAVRLGAPSPELRFELHAVEKTKPVRKVELQ